MNQKLLIQSATKAMNNAFAPFTKILVGAAVLGEDGNIYSGCNVESPFCIETTCAEYNAVNAMIAGGCNQVKAVLICSKDKAILPCGRCRQYIFEFSGGYDVDIYCYCSATNKIEKTYKLSQLMPNEASMLPQISFH